MADTKFANLPGIVSTYIEIFIHTKNVQQNTYARRRPTMNRTFMKPVALANQNRPTISTKRKMNASNVCTFPPRTRPIDLKANG